MTWLREIELNGFFDVLLTAVLIYIIIIGFKKTRAAFILRGILIVTGIYLLAEYFNLAMLASLLEKFFAIILIILIVIFQEEIRRFFERVALWSLKDTFAKKKAALIYEEEIDILTRSVMDLAQEKIGAIIVLKGKDIILRHLDGGVELDGKLSEPLLKSLFDPHSIGHDGAVVIDGRRVTMFSAHLPLSRNLLKVKSAGTRHAAALGLSELSDALCVVSSEEKGRISIARYGEIKQVVNAVDLRRVLIDFYSSLSPKSDAKPWEEILKRNSKEKIYALILALGVWVIVVFGSQIIFKDISVPVNGISLPAPWVMRNISATAVEMTLRGPRKELYFLNRGLIKFDLDLELKEGEQSITLHSDDFSLPKLVLVEAIEPKEIIVQMEKRAKN